MPIMAFGPGELECPDVTFGPEELECPDVIFVLVNYNGLT